MGMCLSELVVKFQTHTAIKDGGTFGVKGEFKLFPHLFAPRSDLPLQGSEKALGEIGPHLENALFIEGEECLSPLFALGDEVEKDHTPLIHFPVEPETP